MEKWKTSSSTYIHKSPFGNIRRDTCELPNGLIIEDYFVNEYADWVNAVVVTADYQIVLVKQYRHAAKTFFLEVPAGKAEGEETAAEAIRREVEEETGYTSKEEPIFLGEYFVNPATQTNKVITFLIQDATLTSAQNLDATEEIKVKHFPVYELYEMLDRFEINHLFTSHALQLARSRIATKSFT